MQETEGRLVGVAQGRPVGTHRLQQVEGPDHVGLDELAGAMNGPVHVALGGEIHHGAGSMVFQQLVNQCPVANIALHEHMPCVALQGLEIFGVAGIGQLVQIDHGLATLAQPVNHKVRSDEASGPCYQNHGYVLEGECLEWKRKRAQALQECFLEKDCTHTIDSTKLTIRLMIAKDSHWCLEMGCWTSSANGRDRLDTTPSISAACPVLWGVMITRAILVWEGDSAEIWMDTCWSFS
ncbi:hypothetical protein D9M69_544650 [compost metagenome]